MPTLHCLLVALSLLGAPQDVAPVDLATIKVADFADDELDLPYYLVNFHRVANSVPLEGDQRGWITASVWRGNNNQRTYNARIMESQLSLAYFYCTKRPWNPYYADPAVRARLEAMLERWCNMQGPHGKFTEYSTDRFGLAPTAFATKFMGESLRLLADGPPIDPALHDRVKQAQRKAILITLTDSALWDHGRKYSNQFTNVWAGGLAWLALVPDDNEVRKLLKSRMQEAAAELQSPAGYFYERDGVDWGYNLSTHHSNLHVAWHYARGTEFEPLIANEVRRYYDWLAWNAAIEPDGSGFVLNRAIETRQRRPWLGVLEGPQSRNHSSTPYAEQIESVRAFSPSREQQSTDRASVRAALAKDWPKVPALEEGNFRGFTPYAFLHRSMGHWLPTAEQQAATRAKLPYTRDGSYAHVRADNRYDVYFLYVRRPGYYLAFNGGQQLEAPQRYGLGLLWSPRLGTFAQSQTASSEDAWGTTMDGAESPYEATDVNASVQIAGKPVKIAPGAQDLPAGELSVHYLLRHYGRKAIRFEDDQLHVETEHEGKFSESIPLLVRDDDRVRIAGDHILIERAGKLAAAIEFDQTATAELAERSRRPIGPYKIQTARIKSTDKLSYTIDFNPDPALNQQAAAD